MGKGSQCDVDVYRPCTDAYNLFSDKMNAVKVVTLTKSNSTFHPCGWYWIGFSFIYQEALRSHLLPDTFSTSLQL